MERFEDTQTFEWNGANELATPFTDSVPTREAEPESIGFSASSQNLTPFNDLSLDSSGESEPDRLVSDMFADLRDEQFDEALAFLAEETEQALADRFTGESAASGAERERFADSRLAAVRLEAEHYLQGLEAGLAEAPLEELGDDELDELLDRHDPQTGELTPAGEEFLGSLVNKAKKVAKAAVAGAKVLGKLANPLLMPMLKKLRQLVNPLLKRVLAAAIGRLPAPLQPVARTLATRITSEAGDDFSEAPMSPANPADMEALAVSFDAALAESFAYPGVDGEQEAYAGDDETSAGTSELERLAEARARLQGRLSSADGGLDLAPDIEQFVPAVLGALRLGIKLVGRPKVVGFLAKYLAQAIGKWVGPEHRGPLSNAIADIGLRLISLEAEADGAAGEAGTLALAGVVEDTVRRLAENEDYIFDNEDLMQLAAAEALGGAVATYFPQRYVRPSLQQAPSLGGAFVTYRPGTIRSYHKYSRAPDVEISEQIADAVPTFGGTSLGAVLRSAGIGFPVRAHMHIYQSALGTSLARIRDRAGSAAGLGYASNGIFHPLTPTAAGFLLREPRLGVAVPPAYLRSPRRIAAGQRFYRLEMAEAGAALAQAPAGPRRKAADRLAPSRAWMSVKAARAQILVGLFLSEADAQRVAEAIRQGRGSPTLLQALVDTFGTLGRRYAAGGPAADARREEGEGFEELVARAAGALPGGFKAQLRGRVREWVLPALAAWARDNGEAFARAAAAPEAGVTVRVQLGSVPGLDILARAAGAPRGAAPAPAAPNALSGTPTIAITVTPGRRRK